MRFRTLLLCLVMWPVGAVVAHPGQHDQLLEINREIEQAPGDQALLVRRGMIYSEGGQYVEASADYRRAEALGPPVLVAFEQAVLHYRMAEYEHATAYLNQYLQRFPDYPPAYDYLARIARDAGDYDSAVANLEIYFRLQDRPNPGHYLSAVKMLEENGRHAQALAILDQGLATLGIVPQLQRPAIALELERGRPDLAVARMETLRPVLGDSPAWQLEMADLLVLVERREEAVAMVTAAQAQLAGLRPTPARLALQQRAEQLVQRLGQKDTHPTAATALPETN